ncbi:MAG: DUF86 domain-containing protein [Nanoarchaeota archaeon]|nr:DUF86 domain-containing protein [Nanoarchaeota archaeon]
MKKEPLTFVVHVLESINRVESFLKDSSKSEFLSDELLQSAVIRQIEIIGEAVKNLSFNFTKKYSNVPWKGIVGMRDKITHHYFGLDLDTIWDIIKEDIPVLKKEIKKILEMERSKFKNLNLLFIL